MQRNTVQWLGTSLCCLILGSAMGCDKPSELGESCAKRADCADGLKCLNQTCVRPVPLAPPTNTTAAKKKSKESEVETRDVELTLVTPDYKNLGCAMPMKVAGLHCAFTAQDKKRADVKTAREDPKLLQPMTTKDRKQFMAAGLWTQPALKAKLDNENFDRPSPRFTVSCKLTIVGTAHPNAVVQWKPGEGWHRGSNWDVGTLSDCVIK